MTEPGFEPRYFRCPDKCCNHPATRNDNTAPEGHGHEMKFITQPINSSRSLHWYNLQLRYPLRKFDSLRDNPRTQMAAGVLDGPTIWNSRDPDVTTDNFKRLLKTFLFSA